MARNCSKIGLTGCRCCVPATEAVDVLPAGKFTAPSTLAPVAGRAADPGLKHHPANRPIRKDDEVMVVQIRLKIESFASPP